MARSVCYRKVGNRYYSPSQFRKLKSRYTTEHIHDWEFESPQNKGHRGYIEKCKSCGKSRWQHI